jgi:excisionase family DNA binding protein
VSITTSEAARRLGVSAHEVRRLVGSGDLAATPVGRMLLVDQAMVRARMHARPGPGRALAPRTAWAALWEASGERATWLDRSTRSRLRRWLREHDAEVVAAACRRRAERTDLRVLATYRDDVVSAAGVVISGITARDQVSAGISAVGDVADEVYCSRLTLGALTREYGLARTGPTNVVVRVPAFGNDVVLARLAMPVAVVAIDLSESTDVRTRRAGFTLLARAIDEHIR